MFLLQKRLAQNIPKILDSQRVFDPSILTAGPQQARDNADLTSPKAKSDVQLMDDFPGAESIGRRKGWGFEMGRRQQNMVVTEDVGKPSE